MGKKLYHHLPDGTFRNPEGSPGREAFENLRKRKGWSFRIFNQEKKKNKYYNTFMACGGKRKSIFKFRKI